ncbi:MAG: hypothetical protein ACE15D_10110 [Candidatus Eisenbacteria bacterium]|nr:hypothetical protein [Candidatus Eisenbacteria bacterium]
MHYCAPVSPTSFFFGAGPRFDYRRRTESGTGAPFVDDESDFAGLEILAGVEWRLLPDPSTHAECGLVAGYDWHERESVICDCIERNDVYRVSGHRWSVSERSALFGLSLYL